MNLLIIKKPNEILSKKLESVKEITPQIKKLILNMRKVMKEASGVGLAANQVGQDMQFFIIDENLAKEYSAPSVYINPEVKSYSKDEEELEEGCLSIPETWLKIRRYKKVKVKTVDETGKKFKFIAKGILARVLQGRTFSGNRLYPSLELSFLQKEKGARTRRSCAW
ncbi:MAG: peptide deformylase [Parcubacteria group bacterium Gr01-1014_2]|nr:MAG: peptide deformylase [Parcubacteria group bacterium Gr01-1014_2]